MTNIFAILRLVLRLYLTSSKRVMVQYANDRWTVALLVVIGSIVTYLNVRLLVHFIGG